MVTGSRFHIIRVRTWEDAVQISRHLAPRWVFRGQSDSNWSLVTTVERAAQRLLCSADARAEREDCIVTEFQRSAHHFLSDLPHQGNRLEWLALLQHHGAPTRLLDFTWSFYIAAFFAMESATQDAAIWAIDRDALDAAVAHKGGIDFAHVPPRRLNSAYIMLCNNAYEQQLDCKLVVAVEPERKNERLSAQKGLFLFPFDLASSFEDNLAATFAWPSSEFTHGVRLDDLAELDGLGTCVLKIVLARELHQRAIEDLRMMNVSAAELFPGLDGFVRSLQFHLGPNGFENA